MKNRFLFLLLMLFVATGVTAQNTWTVRTVPNTRLQSDFNHVSDPDDYLSDSAELAINQSLSAIRSQADIFLVTLTSIGDADPKRFATELFNYWGIGDAELDNGVLLLFVEDQHALEFETGYGAETTLTDAKCERIFTNTIVPYFKAGDYEGGLYSGVAAIVEVYGGEASYFQTTPPKDSKIKKDSEKLEWWEWAIIILLVIIWLVIKIGRGGGGGFSSGSGFSSSSGSRSSYSGGSFGGGSSGGGGYSGRW